MENVLQENDSLVSNRETQQSTDLNSRSSLLQRLRRSRLARSRFVESNISKALAFQIRSLREKENWSQQHLAEKIESNQNAVYRAENPNYGKQTITTLKKIAAAFDVALVVRFVPFSELLDWVSGTPRMNIGLSTEALSVLSFEAEEKSGLLEPKQIFDFQTHYVPFDATFWDVASMPYSGSRIVQNWPLSPEALVSIWQGHEQAEQTVPSVIPVPISPGQQYIHGDSNI